MTIINRDKAMRKMPENNERINNCDGIKAILMLSVVLCHSVSFWTGSWFSAYKPTETIGVMSVISGFTGSFHVFAFTLVSGYLFHYLKAELGKYGEYKAFIINKMKRLLIPYYAIGVLWVFPFSCVFFRDTVKENAAGIFLGTNPFQLWFLLMLFWVFLIYWPLSRISAANDVLGLAVSVGLFGVGWAGRHFCPDLFQVWTGCQYVIFFEIGWLIRKYDGRINHKLLGALAFTVHIGLFVGRNYLDIPSKAQEILNLVMQAAGAVSAFELLQYPVAKIRENKRTDRFLKILTMFSMPVYLFHQQVIYIVIALMNGRFDPFVTASVSLIGSIAVSVLITLAVTKFKAGRKALGVR